MINKYTIKGLDAIAKRVAKEKAKEYSCNGSKFKFVEWKLCTEWGDWDGAFLEIKFEKRIKDKFKNIVYFNEHL